MRYRLPDPPFEALTPEQQRVHRMICAGPRGAVVGPLKAWLTNPGLAERAQELGAYCRYGTSLPPRLSELAILIVGAQWRAGLEWFSHAPIAQAAGLGAEVIEALRTGRVPVLQRDEAAVYAFARELLAEHAVSDEAYAALETEVGPAGAVDLVGLLGYYSFICMTINAFRVPLPPGVADPFAG